VCDSTPEIALRMAYLENIFPDHMESKQMFVCIVHIM